MKGILYGVGVGPGDPMMMTLQAVDAIRRADVIAIPKSRDGGEGVAYAIAKGAVPEIEEKAQLELSMPMTRDRDLWNRRHDEAAAAIGRVLDEGKNVVFLTLGDPSIYATYIYVHERVLALGYECRMIPGIPSFCAVAATLNMGLTDPALPLHIVPGSYEGASQELDQRGTKVLMKTGKAVGEVKKLLKEKGMYEHAQMVERCGMEGQRIYKNLDEADDTASYFSIIVVKD